MSPIPVNEPDLSGNEGKYLQKCIETGWISSEGPFVAEFEEKFARIVNRKHGIAVCNGSMALDAAIAALGIGCGDEVIMPTFTIISCAAAVIRAGAIPVLVDSDPITWNMDTNQIEDKISKNTKAIMAVHIYGLPVNMDPLIELSNKYGLKIIEDAAEMHGQTYCNKPCGSFGDISTFSFYPNKHITTGEGGMILTDCDKLAEKCRSLRNLCFQQDKRFIHEDLGWNMRMTNLQAALGVAQLERFDDTISKKRWIGKTYRNYLSDSLPIQTQPHQTSYAENIYWVFGLTLDDSVPYDAQQVMSQFSKESIGTRPFFWPMHKQPVFIKKGLFKNESYPISERISQRGLYLPSGLAITQQQIEKVSTSLGIILHESSF